MATRRGSTPQKKRDQYANVLTTSLTLSAANTLSFNEVELGLSLFDKVGLLLSRIEYHPGQAYITEMTASGDDITMALTTSNQISTIRIDEQAVIHSMTLERFDTGTAANSHWYTLPFVSDLSGLPGGGILITPRPLYLAGDSSGISSAAVLYIRVFFTVIPLAPEDYFELLETRHYFG